MNLMGLAQLMERRSYQLEHNTLQLKKKVAVGIVTHLANATPVDTGRAISNWQIEFSTSNAFALFPYAPGEKGSTRASNISATIATAQNQASKIKLGQLVFIRNHVDYIVDLNDGTSKQSAGGFVETSILIAQQIINNYRLVANP